MPKRAAKNISGRMVRKLRMESGLSQEQFAAKCQRMGWDIGRDTVAKIELQTRCVTDIEILKLAMALNVTPESILNL